MKILHISYWDKMGGAAIAAHRLHTAMVDFGLDSNMLVVEKSQVENKRVFSLLSFKNKVLLFLYATFSSRILAKYRPLLGSFSLNFYGLNLEKHPLVQEADIIYLHWINNSMLSLSSIAKILKTEKLVIWFMHDMYPLTGGCHHSFECKKYMVKCGACDLLKSKYNRDLSYKQLKLKKKYFSNVSNLIIVSPSNWLAQCAQESSLFNSHTIKVIPNLIIRNEFNIIDKNIARNILNFPANSKLVLFGADMGVNNPYKGWSYLKDAIKAMSTRVSLVIFGGICSEPILGPVDKVYNMGRLHDIYSLNLLYSACDVFVIPSLAESFGQTALEAIVCGTPVVGFNVGGIPDIIQHKKNGYLAKYKDSDDFREGIEWCLHIDNLLSFSKQCHNSGINRFGSQEILELHKNMISNYWNDKL